MKKKTSPTEVGIGDDAMRPEYDFSNAVRGATAKRYAKGTNVVVIAPEVLDVFPDSQSVNEALRALAPVIRHQRGRSKHPYHDPSMKPIGSTRG